MIEGLRLRMDGALRIIDRGAIIDAARHALDLHQWVVAPDAGQKGEVQRTGKRLAAHGGVTPLLAAARSGSCVRAAPVRIWTKHRLLHVPDPADCRAGDADPHVQALGGPDTGVPRRAGGRRGGSPDLLFDMERAWFAARAAVAGRRSTSRAAAAVDILAAAPLLSATSHAAGLG